MSPKQLIDTVIAPVAQLLREAGFRKSGRRFYRDAGETRIVLEVQASQWNREGNTRFTINLGLFVPEVSRKLGRTVCDRPNSPQRCTWNERIGFVSPSRIDLWWEIAEEKSIPEVATKVVEVVREFGLPWLEGATTYEGFRNALASSYSLGAADMLWALGHREDAIACVKCIPQVTSGRVKVLNDWLESHALAP